MAGEFKLFSDPSKRLFKTLLEEKKEKIFGAVQNHAHNSEAVLAERDRIADENRKRRLLHLPQVFDEERLMNYLSHFAEILSFQRVHSSCVVEFASEADAILVEAFTRGEIVEGYELKFATYRDPSDLKEPDPPIFGPGEVVCSVSALGSRTPEELDTSLLMNAASALAPVELAVRCGPFRYMVKFKNHSDALRVPRVYPFFRALQYLFRFQPRTKALLPGFVVGYETVVLTCEVDRGVKTSEVYEAFRYEQGLIRLYLRKKQVTLKNWLGAGTMRCFIEFRSTVEAAAARKNMQFHPFRGYNLYLFFCETVHATIPEEEVPSFIEKRRRLEQSEETLLLDGVSSLELGNELVRDDKADDGVEDMLLVVESLARHSASRNAPHIRLVREEPTSKIADALGKFEEKTKRPKDPTQMQNTGTEDEVAAKENTAEKIITDDREDLSESTNQSSHQN